MKNHLKALVLVLLLLLIQVCGFAQRNFKNAVFIEVGGAGYAGSINYEYQFVYGLTGRVGIFYSNSLITIPVTFGKIFGEKKHHFEINSGLTFARNNNVKDYNNIGATSENYIAINAFIGYRYQVPEKRFFFKVGFTPFYSVYDTSDTDKEQTKIAPWAGMGAGFRF